MNITQNCIDSYGRLKNLKLVGKEVGIPWQTVYVHLKKSGIQVAGDKARYGSVSDRISIIGEQAFKKLIPYSTDNNEPKFQSKIDFFINGYSVEIKTSRLHQKRIINGKKESEKWCFCINKQKDKADFFVLYALDNHLSISHIFLIPNEIATTKSTISIPLSLSSKWADYKISEDGLVSFFKELP